MIIIINLCCLCASWLQHKAKHTRQSDFSATLEALKCDLCTNRHDPALVIFDAASGSGQMEEDELDAALSEVYDACPVKSMMLVVAQVDISGAKKLFVHKQRYERIYDSSTSLRLCFLIACLLFN